MAVLIDSPLWLYRGVKHAHLVSDRSYDELHVFAGEIGLPLRAFQGDHYDVPLHMISYALESGAIQVDPRELLGRLIGAGLRRKRSKRF